VIVTGSPPLGADAAPKTLVAQLDATVDGYGDSPALIEGDKSMTWSEVRELSRAIARGLIAQGIGPGDHIATWLPNQSEWFPIWLAAAHIGAVVAPVNTRYQRDELAYVLSNSDAVALFMVERLGPRDYRTSIEGLALPELVVCVRGEGPGRTLDELIASGRGISDWELADRAALVDPDDPTIVIYTSGSTGFPKGVVHSHQVLRQERAICQYLGVDSSSCTLAHMPFFHVAGGLSAVLPALITGSRLVLMDHWQPADALRLVEEHQVSVLGGIATHFVDLLGCPDRLTRDISSLRTGWIGGSFNPREVMTAVRAELGIRVFPAYGMTETTSVTTYPLPTDPDERFLAGEGRPISDYEVRLVDVETGAEVAAGGTGEICVRGHCVMQGYYGDPEATAATVDADGWLQSGDIGVIDDEGYIRIVGRQKDMFIVGGENVFPAEIENVFCGHSAVVQAHVIAVPDERLGEVPYAFIELTAGSAASADDLLAWCGGRLAAFKHPRFVQITGEWPYTGSGKVDKRLLQQQAIEGLGLGELAGRRLIEQFDAASAGQPS
jgi:fatty-acyl-CoA synthase